MKRDKARNGIPTVLAAALICPLLLLAGACGGDDSSQEEKVAEEQPAQEPGAEADEQAEAEEPAQAADAPLNSEEQAQLSKSFQIRAAEEIDEENAAAELNKLAAEIESDLKGEIESEQ
ncbi:MAG: hypothetical protein R6V85_18380 [Polyangia bacterium]